MTDKERLKLLTDLKAARPGYPPGELCLKAADEIEWLAAEVKRLQNVMTDPYRAGISSEKWVTR